MSQRGQYLPDGLLLAYYGDDYTGSSAVMEVMTFAGLPAVMFLDVPTPDQLASFSGYRAIGIAGISRSQSPAWMEEHLPPIFHELAKLGAPVAHYKICSTFDSAPHVGSIGKAIELAAPILGGAWHPLVVGAPALARYQTFGNLFAVVAGEGHRLDRHPVMARHPVTPMDEADVLRHLARQTSKASGLVDFVSMKQGRADERLKALISDGAEVVALDVLDEETLAEAGRLMWEHRGERMLAIGSQGIEYALVAHWRKRGLISQEPPAVQASSVERMIAVSGSCSPITAGQIAYAEANGFAALQLNATRAVDAGEWQREIGRATELALRLLGEGKDPLVYTARGPDDPAVADLARAISSSGAHSGAVNDRIGDGLGRLLDATLRESRLKRAAIAGGDTSGHASLALGIYALTARAPIAPGSPLCLAHSEDPAHKELEITLKGGQVGTPDFFCAVKRGGAPGHNGGTRK
ncbi:four-carbon acid sugar kinase family protein [Microvirga makkahensis]|uniref:Four-carbon acid sugar kinase family protein n=1 Tax=Microvirga makkahensis TaxID=1128670 RepID=A0A7X3MWL7_9HYPH|nr:four-carbon acid sugar kinase family protein [Microvirga makkahensis]MXQ14621.1 four-carbon acid sugar kinase family protein [Microvirga makkahensis]